MSQKKAKQRRRSLPIAVYDEDGVPCLQYYDLSITNNKVILPNLGGIHLEPDAHSFKDGTVIPLLRVYYSNDGELYAKAFMKVPKA